jgi:ABC-2 type transport system ATP-binding protein
MLRDLGQRHTIMLSSHMLTEVESLVQSVIILRRGHLGLARRLSELEADATIVIEVRGPQDPVTLAIKNTDGVAHVHSRIVEDGVVACEVRTHQNRDLRELICQRLTKNGWNLRRLDLRRRSLQDRWNEINNWADFAGEEPAGRTNVRRGEAPSTAVKS